MLLYRRPHSSRRFIVTTTCAVITLIHQIEGYPLLVKKAGVVVLGPPLLPSPPKSDASWFDDSAAGSTLVTRSSDDVVHDGVFIPTIATMGALVLICILCIYNLIRSRSTVQSRGAYNGGPIYSSQYAVGQVENGHGSRPPSRISKPTRGSVLSEATTLPGSPSVGGSDMLDRLQRRREEEHRQLQQQDPYEQYMSANQGYPQQPYQYTPHPSLSGSVMYRGGMQPQLPNSAHVLTAQPLMNVSPSREQHWAPPQRQSLQQSDPRQGAPRSSLALTSSTRVSSDVLSYGTPPEARRPPLPSNSSQPQPQDYFSSQYPAGGNPMQVQSSTTQGDIAHSVPANHTPRVPSTTNSAQISHVQGFTNEQNPPGYSTEMMRHNVQGNVASKTPLREKN